MNDEAVAALSSHGDLAGPGADLTNPVAVDRLRDVSTTQGEALRPSFRA
ncbi:hypothetical protein [Streptomyces sp. NRRL S-813]|nr:hypothetical protein [Streptomyces sp. NRRL S-813]